MKVVLGLPGRRAIAKRGYEGAVTTDIDQQAQAVGLFLNDALLQI
jgi:hypothetical protein